VTEAFERDCNVCGDTFYRPGDITAFEFEFEGRLIWLNVCIACWRSAGIGKEWLPDDWKPPAEGKD
jgi:hypothetical protein